MIIHCSLWPFKGPLASICGVDSGAIGRAVAAWVVGQGTGYPKSRENRVLVPDAGLRGDLFWLADLCLG